jgi:hypothetical protein
MTRNWIAMASRTLRMARTESARPRRHRTSPCLENLEHRLSLSSYSAGAVLGAHLNPQPLPPEKFAAHLGGAI